MSKKGKSALGLTIAKSEVNQRKMCSPLIDGYAYAAEILEEVWKTRKPLKSVCDYSKLAKKLHSIVLEVDKNKERLQRIINKSKILELVPTLTNCLCSILLYQKFIAEGNFRSNKLKLIKQHEHILAKYFKRPPSHGPTCFPCCVRVNTRKITMEKAIEHFEQEWTFHGNYVDKLEDECFYKDPVFDALLIFPGYANFTRDKLYCNGSIIIRDKRSRISSLFGGPSTTPIYLNGITSFTNDQINLNLKENGCGNGIIQSTVEILRNKIAKVQKAPSCSAFIIPIGVVGCGKTNLGKALSKLGVKHIQSDDMPQMGRKEAFLSTIADALDQFPIVYADRNNHLQAHRKELGKLLEKHPNTKILYIWWKIPNENPTSILCKRIESRGENHQTLTPMKTPTYPGIVRLFLRQIQPPTDLENMLQLNLLDSEEKNTRKSLEFICQQTGLTCSKKKNQDGSGERKNRRNRRKNTVS